MAAAGTDPDQWQDVCLIGVIPEDDSEIEFGGITSEISALDWGDKEIEGIVNVSGGRLVKKTPQGDELITLKLHPITAQVDGETTATGVAQLFHPTDTGSEQASQPILVDNTRNRKKFGLILLWAETLPATAGALPAESKTAYRIQVVNAYMTSYKMNYDDKVLTADVTFKWTPFIKDGTSNKREESTNGTAQLPAAITTATGF